MLPDADLLIYSVNIDSSDHTKAYRWWNDLVKSDVPIGIYTDVAFAFIRLSTNRRVFNQPLTVEESFGYLNNWLGFAQTKLVETELEDLAVAAKLLKRVGTGGNLTSDAQIAAAALRLDATVHSADADFGRFEKLKWFNPLG
ncbi:MAG: TA system VapC family ribonuclease toxin [Verrucomicrobiota bacterium]